MPAFYRLSALLPRFFMMPFPSFKLAPFCTREISVAPPSPHLSHRSSSPHLVLERGSYDCIAVLVETDYGHGRSVIYKVDRCHASF